MTTSNGSTLPSGDQSPRRVPLRLTMVDDPGRDRLDGAWWPQSRDLAVELADLVDHFPPELGRVMRVLVSPPDWEPGAPRRVPVADGYVKVGSFPGDDTHLVYLTTTNRTVLQVLVVPPEFTEEQGDEALLAGATSGNAHSAGDLLDEVTDSHAVDPRNRWADSGGSWWGPSSVAPSYRRGG